MLVTQFSLGSTVRTVDTGIVYAKTGPNTWQPNLDGIHQGGQAFTASDDQVRSNTNLKPRAVAGRRGKARCELTIIDRINGATEHLHIIQ